MARLAWGADGLLWGDQRLVWGAAPVDPVDPTRPIDKRDSPKQASTQGVYYMHALFRFEAILPDEEDLYIWTGSEDLNLNGQDYIGSAGLVDVTGMGSVAGGLSPDVQVAVVIGSEEEIANEQLRQLREVVSRHIPPVRTTATFIVSDDGGERWRQSPVVKIGRISDAKIQDNLLIFQIASEDVIPYRGDELIWSDESQRRQYPLDRGFEQARAIVEQNVTMKFPSEPDDQFDSTQFPFPAE